MTARIMLRSGLFVTQDEKSGRLRWTKSRWEARPFLTKSDAESFAREHLPHSEWFIESALTAPGNGTGDVA